MMESVLHIGSTKAVGSCISVVPPREPSDDRPHILVPAIVDDEARFVVLFSEPVSDLFPLEVLFDYGTTENDSRNLNMGAFSNSL